MNYQFSYLVRFQYIGFRLHGWQKQPHLKTVHAFVDKTFKFIRKDVRCKTLGVGRTDAMVSATDYYFQLFIDEAVMEEEFIEEFNTSSPPDIRVIGISRITNDKFNIIQHSKIKEYRYYFSHGQKNHPYCAPLLTGVLEFLDIDKMKRGALLFEGYHNFRRYCTKPSEHTKVERTVISCKIEINTEITASFFPEESYVLIVKGQGFLRNQIRLMMAALFELGKGNYTLDFIKETLDPNSDVDFLKTIAPASGLHLHNIDFLE